MALLIVNRDCVAIIQDLIGSQDLSRQKKMRRAVGMLAMPLLMGGRAAHDASCASL